MKTLFWSCLIGALGLVSASSANAGPFGNLRFGQALILQCEERGCYHGRKLEFVFTRVGQVQAEVFECGTDAVIDTRRRLGSTSLTENEMSAFDALFEVFTQPDNMFSTTSVRIRLRLKSPGEADRLEHRVRLLRAEEGDLGGALFALAKRVQAAGAQPGKAEPIWRVTEDSENEAVDALLQQASAVRALASDYEVRFVGCADEGPGEPVLSLQLVPRRKQLIDDVEWEIPIAGRSIVWPDMRSVLLQATRRLEAVDWLRAWKARSPESQIILRLRGTEAGGTGMELARHLQPVWKHSELQSQFRWRVTASRQPYDAYRRCSLDLLIGDADPRVLLVDSNPPMASGWSKGAPSYERVETGWDRKDRTLARYAIIQMDGRIEARDAKLPMVKW